MSQMNLFEPLEKLTRRPKPFEFYTADALWTDEHISKQMLTYHLNETVDLASRNHAFIASSADWIIDRFRLEESKSVCDFGCGPGLYTTKFAGTGASVTGIDYSGRSIEYARETAGRLGLKIDYVLQDYLDFPAEKKFDLITMIFCDFCALNSSQRKKLLDKFNNILKDGGAVLLDVLTLNHLASALESSSLESFPEGGFWSAEPFLLLTNNFVYETEKVTLGKHCIIERDRTREIFNWLQCFNRESIAAEFQASGLAVEAFFGDIGGSPLTDESTQMAVIARNI